VVVAGSSAIDRADRFTQEYLVQRIVGHERYNMTTLENDIALLFLNGFIPWLSQAIRPIPLAKEAPEEGTICLIHGWGKVTKVSLRMGVGSNPSQSYSPSCPLKRASVRLCMLL